MILVISMKRIKNESTVQRITPSKKKTRLRKIKDMNVARKLELVKAIYLRKKTENYILGDNMIKNLNGYDLTKKVRHKFLFKVHFPVLK